MPTTEQKLRQLAEQALICSAQEAPGLLLRLGFSEPERALQALDRLAGEPPGVTPLPVGVLVEIAGTGRPDRGLWNLERYVDVTGGRTSLFTRFEEDPALVQRLVQLLSYSTFLTDILIRNPEYLFWLFEETDYLEQPLDEKRLRADLLGNVQIGTSREECLDALRRAQRRELLRIGAAEILGLKSVEQIGRELADLADAVLEIVLDLVMADLLESYGRPRTERGRPAQFCIVCLGKHGGQELNFSSDIDLMFVYDEDGETRPGRQGTAIGNDEFFRRLGENLIKDLTAVTHEGFLYRVDMRLRPEGSAGLLVRSLRSCWIYYETRGEIWERQMLVKGRCAAGSRKLWKQFSQMLVPFIYPAHFFDRPQNEIRRVKERIEAHIMERSSGGNNIKLQAGGIRDIEFIVQCLQLLNGRINPRARAHNSLDAIGRLKGTGMLSRREAEALRRAYLFFRRIENLLQIEDGRSVYAVPEDPGERRALAGILGLADAEELMGKLEGHRERVRQIYDALFYGEEEPADRWEWLLEVESGSKRAVTALEEQGFADGTAAHRNLHHLFGMGMMMSMSRQQFEGLLPELLASLAAAPDPDQGLVRFAQIVEVYGAPGMFFELLHLHPGFRKLLISICGSSRFLSEQIRRDPGLLDGLVTSNADGALADAVSKGDMGAVARYRNQELLRIGTDDLLELALEEETFLRLTELAEQVLQMVYRQAWRDLVRRRGKPRDRRGREARFVCFAGGKFGGREMDFGSDLDLFFVFEGEGETGRTRVDNSVFFIELAQEILRLLQEEGFYKVDARLRPEGGNAPMAVSLTGYRRYLKRRAATWERLALSRARVVAGDRELGERVQRAIERFVFQKEVDAGLVAEMSKMRRRMEPKAGWGKIPQINIKRSPGGIVDIEFIAQLLVLRHGRKSRRLRLTSTRQALERLVALGLIEGGDGRFLLDAYERLRLVEKGMRIASEQAEEVLPNGRELEVLARGAGVMEAEVFIREISELMEKTRQIFNRIFADGASGKLAQIEE